MSINSVNNMPHANTLHSVDSFSPAKPEPKSVELQNNANSNAELQAEFKEQEVSDELIEKSLAQANETLRQHSRYIERQIHDVTRSVIYQLKDANTDEIISEFPQRKIQDMVAKMWEMAGLFVDKKA